MFIIIFFLRSSSHTNLPLISGHADNLARAQKADVQFVLHTLPIIEYMADIAEALGNGFNLFSGTSAETSGGLLIAAGKEEVTSSIFLVGANSLKLICHNRWEAN